jgi:hypothetical protein
MDAHVFTADYAVVNHDKLTAVGLGWSFINSGPASLAVVVIIDVPWTATNQPHAAEVTLVDGDGGIFTCPDGSPLQIRADFEIGRPPGHPVGVGFTCPLAMNCNLQLPPSTRFEWVLTIDGESDPRWRAGFSTRPPDVRLAS